MILCRGTAGLSAQGRAEAREAFRSFCVTARVDVREATDETLVFPAGFNGYDPPETFLTVVSYGALEGRGPRKEQTANRMYQNRLRGEGSEASPTLPEGSPESLSVPRASVDSE